MTTSLMDISRLNQFSDRSAFDKSRTDLRATKDTPAQDILIENTDRSRFQKRYEEFVAERNKKTKTRKQEHFEAMGLMHKPAEKKKNTASGVGDFMRLFLAQLECQNPLEPQDGAEFVAQLAQFTQVQETQKQTNKMDALIAASTGRQVFEATSLIGKQIEVPTHQIELKTHTDGETETTEVIEGYVHLPKVELPQRKGDKIKPIQDLTLTVIRDKDNLPVDTIRIGSKERVGSGDKRGQYYSNMLLKGGAKIPFSWDGTKNGERIRDMNGKLLEDGDYRIYASVMVGDKKVSLKPYMQTRVTSVAKHPRNPGEIQVFTKGLGSIPLHEVKEISDATRKTTLPTQKPGASTDAKSANVETKPEAKTVAQAGGAEAKGAG